MRVVVDEQTCQHHGQCMIECPQVFQLVSPQELRYQTDVDEWLREDVEAAADAGPTMSITIEGETVDQARSARAGRVPRALRPCATGCSRSTSRSRRHPA